MKRLGNLALLLALGLGIWASFAYLGLQLGSLFSEQSLTQMSRYALRFLQPDLSSTHLQAIARGTLETLAMSALGTLLRHSLSRLSRQSPHSAKTGSCACPKERKQLSREEYSCPQARCPTRYTTWHASTCYSRETPASRLYSGGCA